MGSSCSSKMQPAGDSESRRKPEYIYMEYKGCNGGLGVLGTRENQLLFENLIILSKVIKI